MLTLLNLANSNRACFALSFLHHFFASLKNVSIEYLQVLDFFNTRMDAQRVDGDWSVSEVLQVIIVNCRSWRGDGMKVIWKNIVICGALPEWNISLRI